MTHSPQGEEHFAVDTVIMTHRPILLANLKQTSFTSTLDDLARYGESKDEEGFVMVGYGIKKKKKKKRRWRREGLGTNGDGASHEEQAFTPLHLRFDLESEGSSGSSPRLSNDDDDDDDDNDHGPSRMVREGSKSCAAELGECVKEMGADLKVNLGYMKDSMLTKQGWLLTCKRIKADWRAAVTVGLVNLPLSISLAVASDCGPVAGALAFLSAPPPPPTAIILHTIRGTEV
jgi:hypothetical protein